MEIHTRNIKKPKQPQVVLETEKPSYTASADSVRKVVFLGDANVGKTSLI